MNHFSISYFSIKFFSRNVLRNSRYSPTKMFHYNYYYLKENFSCNIIKM